MANRLMSLAIGLVLSLAAAPALAQFGAPGQASRGASQAPAAPELSPPPEITGDVVGGNLPSQTLKFGIGLAETWVAERISWGATNALREDLASHLLHLDAAHTLEEHAVMDGWVLIDTHLDAGPLVAERAA